MSALWRRLVGWGIWLHFTLRVYKGWSWLYRRMNEERFLKLPMGHVEHLALIPPLVSYGNKWRRDGWRQLGDVVSSPQYAQEVFLGREPAPEYGLDCDEHAIFEVALIEESLRLGLLVGDDVQEAKLLAVMWTGGGHNVCLLKRGDGWAYMDYGMPSPSRMSIHAVALSVVARYQPQATLVAWVVQRTDLTPERIHLGERFP